MDQYHPLSRGAPDPHGPNPFRRDSPPPPPEFERRRQEDLVLHGETDIICKVVDRVWGVCRIPGRGSGVLVSKVGVLHGVILTTPAVLPQKEDAAGATAAFFEAKVLNGRKQPPVCEVQLRPERLFYSSAPRLPQLRRGEPPPRTAVGYVLVACDLYGVSGGHVDTAALELPLLRPPGLSPKVGDVCLAVQHPNGKERMKYHVSVVSQVHEHHVEFRPAASGAPDYLGSGGAVFDVDGRMVGLGHMQGGAGGVSVAILATDIVAHMFNNRRLGAVHFRVLDIAPACDDRYDEDAELIETKDFSGFFWEDLWRVWYERDQYLTAILVLCAWPYNASLQVRALTELTAFEHRSSFARAAELGGIQPILQAMENLPGEGNVVEQAVLALGRLADAEANRVAMLRHGVLPPLLKAMIDYPGRARVQQWGCYCLLGLLRDGPDPEAVRDDFVAHRGLGIVVAALDRFPSDSHLVRWAAGLLAAAVEHAPDFLAEAQEKGVPLQLLQLAAPLARDDAPATEAVLFALSHFCADWGDAELRAQVCATLCDSQELVPLAGAALGAWGAAAREAPRPELLTNACDLLVNALSQCDEGVAQAVEQDIERKLYDATVACPASRALFSSAVRAAHLLGVDVEEKFAANDMLRDVQL